MSKNNNQDSQVVKRHSINPQQQPQPQVAPNKSAKNAMVQAQKQSQMQQIQVMHKQMAGQGPASSLQLENQPSIEQVQDTANNKSIEDLEMMLQMQEKINSENTTKSRDQYAIGPNEASQGSQELSPKKTLKKNASQKSRVIPQSQQKMTKNSAHNMQPQKSGDRQMHFLNNRMVQAKTMQPKRPSSMNPVKSAQNIRAGEAPVGPQFFQTIGTPKNSNAFKISQGLSHHVQMPTSQSNSPQFDENVGAPTGVMQNHTMQVNRLQAQQNKKLAPNSSGMMPDGPIRPQDGNTANIVSQIMKNQQIQQNINIQQSNINKQQMKGKLNIKVVKNNQDGSKPDPSKQQQQVFYGMPSANPNSGPRATNPSVVGSDLQMQMQMNNPSSELSRQKSPSYVQTLTAYSSQSGSKPHKTSTKKNIKILSNSASLKKTLQNNSSNPSIMNSITMPGSQSEVQGMATKKGPNQTKKSNQQKGETRYQAVLAMEALNQEKNRGSLPNGSIDDADVEVGQNMFQSDYYRTTQNQKFAQTQPVNVKGFNSVSPSRNKGNKAMNSAQKANMNMLNSGKGNQNFGYNFGLQNKAKILQKNSENKTYGNHLINSAGRAMRENSKDSIRKKPYATVSNKGKSMSKFGQGKNSVKPPTKKQVLALNNVHSKQYLTQTNGGNLGSGNVSPTRMKVSRSSMGVGHQMQQSVMSHSSGSQISNTSASAMQVKDSIGPQQVSAQRENQMGNIYTQLSDRVRRKAGPGIGQYQVQSANGNSIKPLQRNSSMSQYTKKNPQQLHYLPIQAKRGSVPHHQENLAKQMAGNNSSASGSRGNQPFSNASGRNSDNKFASQERAVKMAEDNLNKIDEILAQNQKHNQQKKKNSSTLQQDQLQAMTNPQMQMKIHLSEKNSLVKPDSGIMNNDRKSPLGYLTQLNQNTMINLNNNKLVSQKNQTPGKTRVKAKKGSIDKNLPPGVIMPVNNEKLSFTDDMQQFAVLQKLTTQSPIEIPSSSNTSKHSNKTFSQSLVSNTNQYAPEVKKIGQQFNEIVKGLQLIEQSQLEQIQAFEQKQKQPADLTEPPISDVISKLYSVKSSYDSLIKNMSKQITQLQNQIQKPQSYQNMPLNMLTTEKQTSQRVGTMSTSNINVSGSQYNKVSYRKEMTPHGPHVRDPPLSASSQSRTRMDAFVGGTGGSMNKCKYCKGMGQAPSSNSASERHTYAVASDRAVNTVENVPINSIQKMNFGNSAADHITINLPVPKEQSIGSRESQRTKYEEMLEKKYNSDHKKGRTHSVSPNTPGHNDRQNASNNSLMQQIRQLKEENKKMDSIQEQNKKHIKDLQEKDKQIFKADRQLAQSQSAVQKKAQELKDQHKKIKDLEAQLAQVKKQKNELTLKNAQKNERSNSKNRKSQSAQTDVYLENYISEKELDLLVELKHQERKLKKIQKEKTYNANKISKFIYFFFTLQNKGIPVNEIYENDGVKFIQTDRFEEIMGQTNGANNKEEPGKDGPDKKQGSADDQTDQLSFYSDDSYEYVQNNLDIEERSKFKNIHGVVIPSLDFAELPEYETTDEEEEGDEENSYVEANNPFEKTGNEDMHQNQMPEQQLMSPAPHGRLNKLMDGSTGLKDGMQPSDAIRITNNDLGGTEPVPKFKATSQSQTSSKKAMNKKDYQKSIKYIENFYQQSSQNEASDSAGQRKQARQDDSGMLFDDAPKSVTEESSMIGDEKHMAAGVPSKMQAPGTASIPNKLFKGEGNNGQTGTAKKDQGARDKMAQLMDNSIQQNFDQSEKFDESAGQINPDSLPGRNHRMGHGLGSANLHQDAMEIMGITIDSQSFDQSIIDQSMTSELKRKRRIKKQKEDLDGSRLFREHGEEDINDQSMVSQGKPQKGGGSRQKMGKIAHMMQGQSTEPVKGAANKRN